jgi:transposase-like protein
MKTFRVADALLLYRRSELEVTVGVYRPRCACFASAFVATHPEVEPGGRYTRRVKQLVVDAVVRDKMAYTDVQEKMAREFCLPLSTETIFRWVQQTAERIDLNRDYYPWALAQASGTVALDEVYEPCAGIVFLTDPVKDLTLDFQVAEEVTQDLVDRFLQTQKERGLQVAIAITDGSPLYPEPLKKTGQDSSTRSVCSISSRTRIGR